MDIRLQHAVEKIIARSHYVLAATCRFEYLECLLLHRLDIGLKKDIKPQVSTSAEGPPTWYHPQDLSKKTRTTIHGRDILEQQAFLSRVLLLKEALLVCNTCFGQA